MGLFSHSRQWLYPMSIKGRFSSWHKRTAAILFFILGVVPWLRYKGDPLFLANLATRRMTFFGNVFTASDGFLILVTALSAAFGLFLFTALFGRVWCGYACPQSVFMINIVFPIERWIEGSRAKHMRRDEQGFSVATTARKAVKFGLFALIAFVISMSFMGFFVRTDVLWTGAASTTAYSAVAFFTFLWFWDFAWFREQVCNYVCPYARFQGALTDDESLVIAYDVPRGEPRGRDARARGGCIDCNKCVVVCPAGIDIRDGYQLECIACGKCVDACTSVMDKLGYETLVRYTTEAQDEGREARWVRPRTLVYTAILAIVTALGVNYLMDRSDIELVVDRTPGPVFIVDDDGFVRNNYMLRIIDRTGEEGTRTYEVTATGLPEGSQVLAQPVTLKSSEQGVAPLIIRVPRSEADSTLPFTVHIEGAGISNDKNTTFKGPERRGTP